MPAQIAFCSAAFIALEILSEGREVLQQSATSFVEAEKPMAESVVINGHVHVPIWLALEKEKTL